MNSLFKEEDIVSTYTSQQAIEDGFLFDLDLLINKHYFPVKTPPLKYVTTNLLQKGYWTTRCKQGPQCATCEVWIKHSGDKLSCLEPTLNIPNILDLITQALQIFNRKPEDDYFVSGKIELPSGEKQEIFIAQNETGRYTIMLPEDN